MSVSIAVCVSLNVLLKQFTPKDEVPADQIEFIEINEKYSKIWPNITEAKEPMPNHQEWKEKENKIDVLILE